MLVEVDELQAQLQSDSPPVVIDVRGPEAFAAGHIPGSRYVDVYSYLVGDTRGQGLQELQREIASWFSSAGVTQDTAVVFYEDGVGMTAARGLWFAHYAGMKRAFVLNGGLSQWKRLGGALERGHAPKNDGSCPDAAVESWGAFNPSVMATADLVASRIDDPDTVILDVRSWDEYVGRAVSSCCARSGRIPGATWVDWSLLAEGMTGLADPDRRRSVLYAAGITPDSEVIAYCHRGARAAHSWLALRDLGYRNVRNCIGSWHEWSFRTDLPAARGRPGA